MPDNIARRRDVSGEHWLSAGGRGYVLDPASPLCRAEWLVVADAQGQAKGARITAAAPLELAEIEASLGELIERRQSVSWNAGDGRVEARLERRLGGIVLATGPDPDADGEAVADLLLMTARERLVSLVPLSLLARGRYAGLDALSIEALANDAELWLQPLLAGRRDLNLSETIVGEAALNSLDYAARKTLDARAPVKFITPGGTSHTIDYAGDGAPSVAVRVQAMFGCDTHPTIGATPLLLQLTSPAGRPIQSTRDLPGFWRGSWNDVCKDMKGRYPRHRWPDEPWLEKPSLRTKNAFTRQQS